MSTKTVTYTTRTRLPCGCTVGAGVVICCASALTLANSEGDSPRYIEATVLNEQAVTNNIIGVAYQYVFSYSDAQLRTGAVFTPGSIQNVFCKGCLTNYTEDLVALSLGNGNGSFMLDAATVLPIVSVAFSAILTTYTTVSFLDSSNLLRYLRVTNLTNENIYISFDGSNAAAYIPLYDFRDYPLGENFTYLSLTNVWLRSETAVPLIGDVKFEGFY